jgi:hypothetical protein
MHNSNLFPKMTYTIASIPGYDATGVALNFLEIRYCICRRSSSGEVGSVAPSEDGVNVGPDVGAAPQPEMYKV